MYVVREITGMSMEDIGREFGGRDHSTVVYSISDIQKRWIPTPAPGKPSRTLSKM